MLMKRCFSAGPANTSWTSYTDTERWHEVIDCVSHTTQSKLQSSEKGEVLLSPTAGNLHGRIASVDLSADSIWRDHGVSRSKKTPSKLPPSHSPKQFSMTIVMI